MNYDVFEFYKRDLLELAEDERTFLIHILHLNTETDILSRCSIASFMSLHHKEEVSSSAQIAQAIFFIKLMAGKLCEGHQLLHNAYWKSHLSKRYDPLLSEDARASLKEIKRYFNLDTNMLYDIRNNYSFHYDVDRVRDVIDAIEDEDELRYYQPRFHGNAFAEFSELALLTSLVTSYGGGDPEVATKRLYKEASAIRNHFKVFGADYAGIVLEKLSITHGTTTPEDVPYLRDTRLPFLVNMERAQPETGGDR